MAELVANGGFETGSFSNWTVSGGTAGQDYNVDNVSSDVHSGSFGAFFTSNSNNTVILSQTLGGLVPGQTYTLSFWLNVYQAAGTPSQVTASLGNQTLFSRSNLAETDAFTNYTTTFTAPANPGALRFTFYDPPGYFGFDDVSVTCFAAGTLIRCSTGDVAVEDLCVGDLLRTGAGEVRAVTWIGHRAVDCRRHPRPHEVLPVRIAAHAFGEGRPSRELRVSPGHALCLDLMGEVLIPAGVLVNGTTIVQEATETVTYWHVELEGGHAIIFAEDMPCESYIDMGNRGFFAEGAVVSLDARPDGAVPTHGDFCRPFHAVGAFVEVARRQVAALALAQGWRLAPAEGLAGLHLLADGRRVEPTIRGLRARFVLPATAREVWLVSEVGVPRDVGGCSDDARSLGLCLAQLVLDDGFGPQQTVPAGDGRLCCGFHLAEAAGRWTAGRARLPAELWDGMDGDFALRVELAAPPLPRWAAPGAAEPAAMELAC